MTWVAVGVAGASLVGGAIAAGGAESAANTQANAANNATASQQAMFNKMVGLEQPFQQAGVGANQLLSTLLGIPSTSQVNADGSPADPVTQAYHDLLGRDPDPQGLAYYQNKLSSGWTVDQLRNDIAGSQEAQGPHGTWTGATPTTVSNTTDANFGSLLKPFDTTDFQLDPGIQYQLKYGQQALQNSQAAQNGVLSGGALKDLMSFNQDYAGTGYQSAYERYMANKEFTLGALSDVANRGQAAAGNTVNAGASFSSGLANTITGAGNASAAGTVGASNALSSGITGAGNAYLLSSLLKGSGTGSTYSSLGSNSALDSGLVYSNGSLGD